MGKSPIMSLENQGSLVAAAEQAFDFLFPVQLETGFWRFATTIVQLNQTVPAPIGGYYFYAYKLPSNFAKLVHLWPQQYDWDIYENNLLYSNFNDAGQPLFLEYVFPVIYENVPMYFWGYFVWELAHYLSLSNAQMVQYAQYIKPERDYQKAVAMAADCQNRPQTPLQSKPMITRRFVSTFASG
jgi:hypothetical protein